MNEYNPWQIEEKWQKYWEENSSFETTGNYEQEKRYILSMFPYPSGRLHMGHVRNYSISDTLARYYRQKGYNVLHPIGWDSFGLPAENAATKNHVHPKEWTYKNIDIMRAELHRLGFSFSNKREFATSDPLYTKFEQEFILKMFERGLLYKKKSLLNWCDSCHTVLANEQVVDGHCWRCDSKVVLKDMNEYYLKITNYADELYSELENLKLWPQEVITMQKNWIGKSRGLEFELKFDSKSRAMLGGKFDAISVYTTRADTIYGMKFCVLAPEHPVVKYMYDNDLVSDKKTITNMQNMTQRDRSTAQKEGIKLNLVVKHPLTNEDVDVWVGNFVLSDYGSGAVMSVPAHDSRDFDFAKKYSIEMKYVVKDGDKQINYDEAYTDYGILQDSGMFTGLSSSEAKNKIIEYFSKNKLGKGVVNFRLRDWGISRQRYWGAPLPLINCEKCGVVGETNLPVELPDDVEITGSGNPLEDHPTFKYVKCPKCGSDALRECDTMDTFVESSWYFLRYLTLNNENESFSKKDVKYWMGVDCYVGGIEHAILHLLYARFFTKVLRDLGYCEVDEPFKRLITQGMVLKDGTKMSKSKGNIVNPMDIIQNYGADTARLFTLFAAPTTKELEWIDSGVDGAFKFLKRFYAKSVNVDSVKELPKIDVSVLGKDEKYARMKVYEVLAKCENVYKETYAFNTLIAGIMEALNALDKQESRAVWTEGYFVLLHILEPFAPHISWELSTKFFARANLVDIEVNRGALISDTINIAVTINGKRKCEIETSKDASKDEIIAKAKESGSRWLADVTIVKEIYVLNKLVNFVVK